MANGPAGVWYPHDAPVRRARHLGGEASGRGLARRARRALPGGTRQEAFSLPAEKLAQALAGDSVKVLALEGVVGRVLTETMQAMNDPTRPRCTQPAEPDRCLCFL